MPSARWASAHEASPARSGTGSGSHGSRTLGPRAPQQQVRFRTAAPSGESRDSGVSTGQNAGTQQQQQQNSKQQRHYPTPMERLLSNDSMHYQHTLTRLIHIIQEEFAFDGYMENGIEDLSLGAFRVLAGNLFCE